jgi:hypothetical protein
VRYLPRLIVRNVNMVGVEAEKIQKQKSINKNKFMSGRWLKGE